jgi:hypothetical protein
MSEDSKKEIVSRRGFLGMGSAALAAAGMLPAAGTLAQDQKPYPNKGDRSASAPGPGNAPLDTQNPDSFLPPAYRRRRSPDLQVSFRALA